MKDVEKTNIDRANSGKRMRRRKRSMNLYIFAVFGLVAVAFMCMSYTFLFNIEKRMVIVLDGESSESEAEIQRKGDIVANASGVKDGDNLLRVNTKKSAQKILDEVFFVETAEVHRAFPSTLEIKITYCVPSFNVRYGDNVLVVSRLGKIIEKNNFITDGIPTITGIVPVTDKQGEMLKADDDHKNEALTEIMASITENSGISGIDITDEFNIKIRYTNGTLFKMGNWNEAEYKLKLANDVMNNVNGKKGYLMMIGSNQCSFRMTDEPVGVIGGEQIQIPSDNVEVNPEQEAIFNEFNSRAEESATQSPYYDSGYDYSYDYDAGNYFNWSNDAW